MSARKPSKRTDMPPQKRGPKPEILALDGDWEDAVAKALTKRPPEPSKPAPKKPK